MKFLKVTLNREEILDAKDGLLKSAFEIAYRKADKPNDMALFGPVDYSSSVLHFFLLVPESAVDHVSLIRDNFRPSDSEPPLKTQVELLVGQIQAVQLLPK